MQLQSTFPTIEHKVDFCVVGGGLSGLCAAVAAARHGAKVALVQERPMLGGNASSEVRMWVCGAQGKNMLETGLVEELMMENCYRNPDKNYSIFLRYTTMHISETCVPTSWKTYWKNTFDIRNTMSNVS